MKRTLIFILLLVAPLAYAQHIKLDKREGKVSPEEAALAQYEPDTTASAVVLYDYTYVCIDFNNVGEINKTVNAYSRIKILKEDGKSYADFSIPYANKGESVFNIKVVTHNLEDGKLVSTKLARKYIFDELVTEGVRKVSFSAPDVKVGSVVEISYTFNSANYAELEDVFFQQEIPINWLEADVDCLQYLDFSRQVRGTRQPVFKRDSNDRMLGDMHYQLYRDSYVLYDMPALPDESFSYCRDQFYAAASYSLRSIVIPGFSVQSFADNWSSVDDLIRKSEIFKECHAKGKVIDELKPALDKGETLEEKVVALREAILEKVKWNKNTGFVPKPASQMLKEGSSDAASINGLMASVLRAADIQADPVLVRSREKGILIQSHVRMDAFDRLILCIQTGTGTSYYYDAASPDGYLNVLGEGLIVDNARLYPMDGSPAWVDLQSLGKNLTSIVVQESLDASALAVGKRKEVAYGEASCSLKEYARSFSKDEEYISELEKDGQLEITDFQYDKEAYGSSARLQFDYEREHQTAQGRIYVHPFLNSFHSQQAFSSPVRYTPVEFPYAENINYRYNLEIPEGFEVEQLPEDATVKCGSANLYFRLQCARMGARGIQVQFQFQNKDMMILPENYADLKVFWEHLCNVYKSTIVLKKI